LESFNNGQESQFDKGVAGLSIGKFATVKCQRSFVLLITDPICLFDASV
jgi:hypothetical protein